LLSRDLHRDWLSPESTPKKPSPPGARSGKGWWIGNRGHLSFGKAAGCYMSKREGVLAGTSRAARCRVHFVVLGTHSERDPPVGAQSLRIIRSRLPEPIRLG